MLKDFIIVGIGSFFGGGMRFLVAKAMQMFTTVSFPLGTFAVNVLGCFLIGFLSGLPLHSNYVSPTTRLLLITGFCGSFTTFSTFMHDSTTLLKGEHFIMLFLYLVASFVVGLALVFVGNAVAKLL